jgi:hypothetical protein
MLAKVEATLVPPPRKWLRAIVHGDDEAEAKEKALAEHVARHPEDIGRTVKDFNWMRAGRHEQVHDARKERRRSRTRAGSRATGAARSGRVEVPTAKYHLAVVTRSASRGLPRAVRSMIAWRSTASPAFSISGRATPDAAGRWNARPERLRPYVSGIECGGGKVSSYSLDPFAPAYKIKSDAVRLWLTPVNTTVNSAVVFASTSA